MMTATSRARRTTMQQFERTLPGLGERRQVRRRPFHAGVQVLPLDGQLPTGVATAEDISPRGLFMSGEMQYPLGTLLRLKLSTDHGELWLTGRVVHRLDGCGIGCEFVDLDEGKEIALRFLVSVRRGAYVH